MGQSITQSQRALVNVASGALIDQQKQILLAQRPAGKAYAGYWELPGGKLEQGELPAEALSRELMEELGITVDPTDWHPITFVAHSYPDLPTQALVLIHAAAIWTGAPQALEQQAFAWVAVDALADYRLLPTMRAALPAIRAYLQAIP